MPEGNTGKPESVAEKFGEEAEKAGAAACRSLMSELAGRPEMLAAVIDTLPAVLEGWAGYQVSLAGYLEDPEKVKEMMELIPSEVLSILSTVYGPDIGAPLAVVLLVPGRIHVKIVSNCGREKGEPIEEPRSPSEARLRAALFEAHTTVYRVYFELASLISHEEKEAHEAKLWRPREMRILHI